MHAYMEPDVEELVLGWEERLQVALDISHGIEYLHEGVGWIYLNLSPLTGCCLNDRWPCDIFLEQAVPPVIHRDLKSANILLDQSMRAKVSYHMKLVLQIVQNVQSWTVYGVNLKSINDQKINDGKV